MIMNFLNFNPRINEDSFIAQNATIIGQVEILEGANIWFGAVLRGDVNTIKIGKFTNVQDNTVVHCDDDYPTIIGDNVTIGHNSIIHGCIIEDNSLIGMGAIVLNGAKIGSNVIVGAGALVPSNKVIPDNSLVVGSPCKVIRELTNEEIESLKKSAENYYQISKKY